MGCRNSSGQDIIEIVDILIRDFELLHKFVNGGSDETVLLGDPPDQEETATLRNLALQIKWAIEYFLSQLQEVSDPFRYDSYAFNVRRSRTIEEYTPKGTIITIPANYYPSRDILFVSIGGVVLTPKKTDDFDSGERQYEEVGDSPNVQSNKIKILFDLKPGDVVDVWVVASNLMRELATIAAMAQVATDKADEAKVSEETCKEILERIEKLVGTGIMEMGVANIRIGWICDEHVDPGGILTLPTVYYPTRAVLLLSYKGTLCTPKNPRLASSGSYQYEEIGDDPTVTSNKVRLYFEAWIGDEFDVWVCASAVGRNIEEIQAAKEQACACAQQAEDIIENVGTRLLTQATFPIADSTVKAALDYLNPQTGETSHVDIPIPLAAPPASGSTGNAGLFPIESYVQLNTNTADIATLKGRSLYFAVHLGATTITDQTTLQNAFIAASGLPQGTVAPNGTTLVNLDEFGAQGAEYTWYTNTGQWTFRGRAVVTTATNDNLGLVKGTPSVVDAVGIETNGGKTFVEADGSMRLLGYDRLLAAANGSEVGYIPPWSSQKDYPIDSRVRNWGVWYRAIQPSGPGMGGAKEPVKNPEAWRVDFTVHSNVVCYIDYNATTPGSGLYGNSPAQNLGQLMHTFRGLNIGTSIFAASAAGYTATPSVYIIVSGTGDVVDSSVYHGLNIEHINVTFQFGRDITSWTLDTGFFFGVNAGIRINCDMTTTINLPRVQLRNCFLWTNTGVTIRLSGETSMNIVGSDVYFAALAITSSLAYGSVFTSYTSNINVGSFDVNNTVYSNLFSTAYILCSVVHFVNCNIFNATRNISSLYAVESFVAFVDNGVYSFSTFNASMSNVVFNGGTIKLGGHTGDAPDHGMIVSASQVTVAPTVAIMPNAVPPTTKGALTRWSSLQAIGKAPDSWPGTQSWLITAQGYYQS